MEAKYGIEIFPYKAIKPIPFCCKEYGQPFLSKFVSEHISRLQRHNFQWEDESYEDLVKKYPNCKCGIAWWTNHREQTKYGFSKFNINYNKYLKEFMIANPPTFKISQKCCDYAKKKVAEKLYKDYEADLSIIGVRKAEGGIRSSTYKSCFETSHGISQYRPVFWYLAKDKEEYEEHYHIEHSKCYTVYGLDRTGCACCPFGRHFEHELEVVKKYEPKLYKAVNNIFGDSYEYTRRYRQFVKEMNSRNN